MSSTFEQDAETILYSHSTNHIRSLTCTQAHHLLLYGHLDLATSLLTRLFALLGPNWGTVSRVLRRSFDFAWDATGTRPRDAPPLEDGDHDGNVGIEGVEIDQRMEWCGVRGDPEYTSPDVIGLGKLWDQIRKEGAVTREGRTFGDPPEGTLVLTGPNKMVKDEGGAPRLTSIEHDRDVVLPILDRFISSPRASEHDQYKTVVALAVGINLRIGDPTQARAIFDSSAVPLIRKQGPYPPVLLAAVKGIYPLLSTLEILPLPESHRRYEVLLTALETRFSQGVARPWSGLSWKDLLAKLDETCKKEWMEDDDVDTSEPWESVIQPPASDEEIKELEARLGLKVPLPRDYVEFLRTSNGVKGSVWLDRLGGAKEVRIEEWSGEVGLRVEFSDEAYEGTGLKHGDWPVLERVIAIDQGGGDSGDVWLVEPDMIANAKAIAREARGEASRHEEEQGGGDGWMVFTWSHWGVEIRAYGSFREYMESRLPRQAAA